MRNTVESEKFGPNQSSRDVEDMILSVGRLQAEERKRVTLSGVGAGLEVLSVWMTNVAQRIAGITFASEKRFLPPGESSIVLSREDQSSLSGLTIILSPLEIRERYLRAIKVHLDSIRKVATELVELLPIFELADPKVGERAASYSGILLRHTSFTADWISIESESIKAARAAGIEDAPVSQLEANAFFRFRMSAIASVRSFAKLANEFARLKSDVTGIEHRVVIVDPSGN